MKRIITALATIFLSCGLVLGGSAASGAAPSGASVDDARAKLQSMEAQMATAQQNYRSSLDKLASARAAAEKSRKELDALDARITKDRKALNLQANFLYRTGNASFLEALLTSRSFEEVMSKALLLSQVSDSNAKVLNSLRLDLRQRTAAQANLDAQVKTQETQTAALKGQSEKATRDLASQQAWVDSLTAQQAAALQAAQDAANALPSASSKPTIPDPSSGGGDYTGTGQVFYGLATWYGVGVGTASGEPFNPRAMTAAHKTLPFGTLVRVTYQGRSVVVRINDRGPYGPGRVIDLTEGAAEVIGLKSAGVGQVKCEIVN